MFEGPMLIGKEVPENDEASSNKGGDKKDRFAGLLVDPCFRFQPYYSSNNSDVEQITDDIDGEEHRILLTMIALSYGIKCPTTIPEKAVGHGQDEGDRLRRKE